MPSLLRAAAGSCGSVRKYLERSPQDASARPVVAPLLLRSFECARGGIRSKPACRYCVLLLSVAGVLLSISGTVLFAGGFREASGFPSARNQYVPAGSLEWIEGDDSCRCTEHYSNAAGLDVYRTSQVTNLRQHASHSYA